MNEVRNAKIRNAAYALTGDVEWYEGRALQTAQFDAAAFSGRVHGSHDLVHAAMGISGEAGELVDAVKKHVAYGQELDTVNVIEELGDLMWYITLAADAVGSSLRNVMLRNVSKLNKRYRSGAFSETEASTRDFDAERAALEGEQK
jgi:NTP pyrophosphatase (non-canonical NTP hydrolase)